LSSGTPEPEAPAVAGDGVETQRRIVTFVTRANWTILAAATLGALFFTPLRTALGVFSGGVLVTVNFHLLARTLRGALTPPHLASHHTVLAKYYVRFLISGFIIFVLIAGGVVDPLGLVAGLSVVVASIILATIREVTKLIF
jgi:hypothetical protein